MTERAPHVLRLWGLPNAQIRVSCDCGQWNTVIEGGHSEPEIVKLAAQHAGKEPPA